MAEAVKVKVSELEGAALDYAVMVATGYLDHFDSHLLENYAQRHPDHGGINPSRNWGQGGPLIDKHRLWLSDDNDDNAEPWISSNQGGRVQTGPTPLIAAMRALVAAKLGDEIEIPAELNK